MIYWTIPLISHLRWQLLHQREAFLFLQKKHCGVWAVVLMGLGEAIGVLSERAPKTWNQAFSSLSLLPYLVLPKAFALKNLRFQDLEVHRIFEITNFMIEWGKNGGNIEHISEYCDEIISKICISKTHSDNTPMALQGGIREESKLPLFPLRR